MFDMHNETVPRDGSPTVRAWYGRRVAVGEFGTAVVSGSCAGGSVVEPDADFDWAAFTGRSVVALHLTDGSAPERLLVPVLSTLRGQHLVVGDGTYDAGERRRHPRAAATLGVHAGWVAHGAAMQAVGTTVNLSAGGFAATFDRPLPRDSDVAVSLFLPGGRNLPAVIRASVGAAGLHRCRIIGIGNAEQHALRELLGEVLRAGTGTERRSTQRVEISLDAWVFLGGTCHLTRTVDLHHLGARLEALPVEVLRSTPVIVGFDLTDQVVMVAGRVMMNKGQMRVAFSVPEVRLLDAISEYRNQQD